MFNRQLAKFVRLLPESRILYPCIGLGNLLPDVYGLTNLIDGLEIHEKVNDACKFTNYWRDNLNIINTDYLKWQSDIEYDLVIMNPPFDKGSEMIMKAVSELKDGGTIGFIMQSNWRGYKCKKHLIYSDLNKLGRFESIFMLRGPSETKKLFHGIKGGGIDLVVFTKGDKPNDKVKVRNTLGQEFTYDQSKYPRDVPIIDPIIYDQIFDQSLPDNDFIGGYRDYTKRSNNWIVIKTPYQLRSKKVTKSLKKEKLIRNGKIIISHQLDNNPIRIIYDVIGTETVDQLGAFKIGTFSKVKIIALNSLLTTNNIPTLIYTGCGANIKFPPFRTDWFEN